MKIPMKYAYCLALLALLGVAARVNGQGLVLTAHRGTGGVTIRNTTGAPVSIDGYTIGSTNGFLNPANGVWASFDDANIAGWEEANPTTQRLSELNPTGARSLAAGQVVSLGTPYSFAPTTFGNNFQNLSFEYATPGGSRFQGAVQHAGPHNNLVLTVNRTTGNATIQNQSSLAVSIDGYTINSPNGFLNPANGVWSSFDDANIGNWEEANPSPQRLSELSAVGSLSFTPGQTRSLGAPYSFAPTEFGSNLQNLTFEFATTAGARIQGIVEYAGLHNTLMLTVNPTTGAATIQNQSSFAAVVDGYTIASATGALSPVNWSSLDDQNLGAWEEANPNANRLSELSPTGGTTLASSQSLSLGALFNPSGLADLTFEFTLTDGRRLPGIVQYSAPTAGDYDGDGDVNGSDFLAWQRTLGSPASPPGSGADGSGNGTVDGPDLTVWENGFGSGATSLPSVGAVPEPTTFGISLAAVVFGVLPLRGARKRI